MKLILASASPRRREILERLGFEFDIIVSEIEEKIDPSLNPEEIVKSLAYQKAFSVSKNFDKGYLVIGSDTIVVIGDQILGKPKDKQDAERMLNLLSNNTHKVITGVCIINTNDNLYQVENDTSCIKMKKLSQEEIEDYIESGEPFDKAGSYAIQGLAETFVEKIEGSYSGIVGLPVFTLSQMLKSFGVHILGGNNK